MKKQISLVHDYYTECPECGGRLEKNNEWEKLFDIYEKNALALYMVIDRIYKDSVPRFVCSKCNLEILIKSKLYR